MFARLPETGAKGERNGWGTAASVAVHGVIVLLIVVGTTEARPSPRFVPEVVQTVYTSDATSDPGPTQVDGAHSTGATTTEIPRIPLPSTDGALDRILTPGPLALPGPATVDAALLGEIARGGAGVGSGSGAVASELTVDEPVRVVAERAPRYPEALRAAGAEGTVVVMFVVDTMGRAEPASLRVIDSPHEQFTAAVVAVLRASRFTPGRIAGRAVPTLVQRAFRFTIEGRP